MLLGLTPCRLPALLPQWIGRPQFKHDAGAQRQAVRHADVRRAAADHRLQRYHRQVRLARLLETRNSRTTCSPTPAAARNFTSNRATVAVFITV